MTGEDYYRTGLLDYMDGRATLEGVLRAVECPHAGDYVEGYHMGRRLERDEKLDLSEL